MLQKIMKAKKPVVKTTTMLEGNIRDLKQTDAAAVNLQIPFRRTQG